MATSKDEVLLTQEFKLYPKRKNIYIVKITRVGVWYHRKKQTGNNVKTECVQFSDIIGCRCQKTSDSPAAFITIFSYPIKKVLLRSKLSRRRVVIIFEVDSSEDFDSNLRTAETWRNAINSLARKLPLTKEDIGTFIPPAPGKLLILINPFSGTGKALQIFNGQIRPMLLEAEIPFEVEVTEYAGHAHKIVQSISLSEWYGIVIVSGDGLVFEVINGLMARPDWKEAIHLPVGCLPGGSGNALCCSINYSAGEPMHGDMVLHSTFILIKHKVIPMDLVLIQTPSRQIFSFLSFTWGLLSDIDYESEKYRRIGEARFTIGAVKRIFNLRKYRGCLSFLPVAEYTPKVNNSSKSTLSKIRRFSWKSSRNALNGEEKSSSSEKSSQESNSSAARGECSETSHSGNCARGNTFSDNVVLTDLEKEENPSTSLTSSKSDPNLSRSKKAVSLKRSSKEAESTVTGNGFRVDQCMPEGSNVNWNRKEPTSQHDTVSKEEVVVAADDDELVWRRGTITTLASQDGYEIETETALASRSSFRSVPSPLLPPLDQPVPDHWVTIDGTFLLVSAVYQTHLGNDMLAAPHAHLSDGFFYIIFAREGLNKSALFSLFMNFCEGSHVDSADVEIVKALAFRLVPTTEEGNMMVDGEKVEYGPIQGQILPHLSRIMAVQ